VDGAGAAYIAGTTQSANFGFGGAPGFDQTLTGNSDAFAVKLAPNGQAVAYGTFFGGGDYDEALGVITDGAGAAYVTGNARSDFSFGGAPGFNQMPKGDGDGFVLKLAPLAATATATPVAGNCTPRPPVSVSVVRNGDGRLRATISASGATNAIESLNFTRTTGALVDLPNGGAQSGAFTYTPPAGTTSVQVFVRRAPGSAAATAELVVTDACGAWPTLIGGGAGAF